MEKYGAKFDEMPRFDYTYAHDLLYVFENFDEDSFGVLERIDPAKNKAKADIYVEAFSDGEVQDYRDFSGRIARLRNFQKLRSVYRSNAGNGRAGTRNAGLGAGAKVSANGAGMPGTSGGNQAQNQQRTHALTDREILEQAAEELICTRNILKKWQKQKTIKKSIKKHEITPTRWWGFLIVEFL